MIPSLFVSHGSPELVLKDSEWAKALRMIGRKIRRFRPQLALIISAHWLTEGVYLECSSDHKTIHDFHGFSEDLYELKYPAKGNPELCREIAKELGGRCATGRGLDHGAWAVLWHIFPEADVPVSQLSIDTRIDLRGHLKLARKLKKFRDRVLIIGSGGAVHNLRDAILNPEGPPAWAVEFKERLKEMVLKKDTERLLSYRDDLGKLAHPTEEHLIPLFYFLCSLKGKKRKR